MQKLIKKKVEIGVKEIYEEKVKDIRTKNKELVAKIFSESESSVIQDNAKNYYLIKQDDVGVLNKRRQSYLLMKKRKITTCGDRLVLFPEAWQMQAFEIVKLMCCAVEFFTYPFGMNHGFEDFGTWIFVLMAIS